MALEAASDETSDESSDASKDGDNGEVSLDEKGRRLAEIALIKMKRPTLKRFEAMMGDATQFAVECNEMWGASASDSVSIQLATVGHLARMLDEIAAKREGQRE